MEKILEKLIAFNTTTNLSNLALVEYAKNIFGKNGYKIKLRRINDKANLFAYKKNVKPKIILSAHSDTVSASDSWSNNPFKLIKKNDQYFGLGVCDMKIFIAIMLDLATKNLPENIAFLLTFNEELDFAGAKLINKKIMGSEDIIIIGEPTSNQAILANKGVAAYKIKFTGMSGHGSESSEELSTIEQAASFVKIFRQEFQKFALKNKDENFSNPLPILNFGQIAGGEAINKIAECTEVIFEMRVNDQKNILDLGQLVQKAISKLKTKTKIERFFTYPTFKASNDVKKILKNANIPIAKGASFATEAGILANLTKNIIIFGPGDIKNAHQMNESIKIADIEEYQLLIEKFIKSSPPSKHS